MWCGRYWGERYWNERYWCKEGADPATGGFGSGASGIGQAKTYSDENLIGGGGSW